VVKDIAAELGTTPSRVALARTLLNPLSPDTEQTDGKPLSPTRS
jgi:hypothetical protein